MHALYLEFVFPMLMMITYVANPIPSLCRLVSYVEVHSHLHQYRSYRLWTCYNSARGRGKEAGSHPVVMELSLLAMQMIT